jgi:hypothetical protein
MEIRKSQMTKMLAKKFLKKARKKKNPMSNL